jgi:hypothetical protein
MYRAFLNGLLTVLPAFLNGLLTVLPAFLAQGGSGIVGGLEKLWRGRGE